MKVSFNFTSGFDGPAEGEEGHTADIKEFFRLYTKISPKLKEFANSRSNKADLHLLSATVGSMKALLAAIEAKSRKSK